MSELRVLPVPGIGEVHPGDDLAQLITRAAPWLADGDVLVVTSKIVSKAEGRLVDLPPPGPRREAAREAVLAAETARPVARRGDTRIVQTHHGLVLASAGIDASNVDSSRLVLLPEDPDRSARALRAALRERHGHDIAVVITDTMGRPWRLGLVDVAIGVAGIEPLVDYRGRVDRYGNELQMTVTAVADELAAAAELVKGKLDGVPAAVIRGYPGIQQADGPGAAAMIRGADLDLFATGTAEARAEGLRRAARLPDPDGFAETDLDPDQVRQAVAAAIGTVLAVPAGAAAPRFALVTDERVRDKVRAVLPPHTIEIVVPGSARSGEEPPDPWALAGLGAAVQRLRAALAADGLALAWVPADAAATLGVAGQPVGDSALGLLGVGVPAGIPAD